MQGWECQLQECSDTIGGTVGSRQGRDSVRFSFRKILKSREDNALRALIEEKGQVCQRCEGKVGVEKRADDAKITYEKAQENSHWIYQQEGQ